MRRLLHLLLAAWVALAPGVAFAQWDSGPGSRPRAGQGRFNALTTPLPRQASVTRPAVAQFTQVNFGGGTAATDYGAGVKLAGGGTQTGFAAMVQTPPAAPYSVYFRYDFITRMAQFQTAGIVFRNSSNGRALLYTCSMRGNEGVVTANNVWQVALMFERFSSLTSFSANTSVTPGSRAKCPQWLRADVTSTTITVAASEDGIGWSYINSSGTSETISSYLTAAGGSLDQIGFANQSGGVTSGADLFIQSFGTSPPS